MLRRRWMWGAGVGAAVLAAAALILLLARPVYRAEARLRLGEPPPPGGVSPTTGVLSFLRPGGDPFANDQELLSSRTLVEALVRDAALSVTLHAPRGWHRDSVFLALAVDDSTTEATWSVAWRGELATVRRVAPRDSLVGSFPAAVPVRFGGVTAVFRRPAPGAPADVELTTLPLDEAVRVTASQLTAERTRREANVLDLEYRSTDPGLAREVMSAAVRNFAALRSSLFQRESRQTMDSLRTVAAETRQELRLAEEALEAMQRQTGMVAPEAQSEVLVTRFAEVSATLEEARAERALLAAQVARVEEADDPQEAWTALVATPAFLANVTVGDLLTRLTQLDQARTEILSRRTSGSREARNVEAQIAQLDQALRALAREYRQGLDERIRELEERVAALGTRLEALPAAAVELGRLQRDVRVLSELLVLTEQRLRQEEIREALSFSTIQVIDPPAVRYRPVWPRKRLGLAVGLLLAAGAGALAMILVDRADATVRRAATVRGLTDAPVLAVTIRGRGGPLLTEAESTAIRGRPGGVAGVVACPGAEQDARGVASVLTPGREPRPVAGYADAVAAGPPGSAVVLVVATAATTANELGRTVRHLREAGLAVAGTVLICADARQAEAVWD